MYHVKTVRLANAAQRTTDIFMIAQELKCLFARCFLLGCLYRKRNCQQQNDCTAVL